MDAAVTGSLPYVRDAAGNQMSEVAMPQRLQSGKRRTALILALVALLFFIGVIMRHWLW